MLSDFAYYKHNIDILSKIAGIKITITEKNSISCENSDCNKVIKLPAINEASGYVFFCQCDLLYFCVASQSLHALVTPVSLSDLNKTTDILSVFKNFEAYHLLKDILGVTYDSYTFNLTQRVKEYIKNSDKDTLSTEISDYISYQFSHYGKSFLNVKSKITELILGIMHLYIKNDIHTNNIAKFVNIIKLIQASESISELYDSTISFIELIFQNKAGKPQLNKQNLITEALIYIQNNYSKNITLAEISNKIFVSPTYLSRIFKEVTGETFLTNLNKIRIEKAKFYLENTTLSIQAISGKTGFPNPGYFSKTFKKFTKLTPLEYRKQSERIIKNVDL